MNTIKIPSLSTYNFRKKTIRDINSKIDYWKKYLEKEIVSNDDKENIDIRIKQYADLRTRVERLAKVDRRKVVDFCRKHKIICPIK